MLRGPRALRAPFGLPSARMLLHQPLHLAGVVAAAGEWRAHHLQEAQLIFAVAPVGFELLRRHEAIHRQMLRPGGEVLADGHDVDLVLA